MNLRRPAGCLALLLLALPLRGAAPAASPAAAHWAFQPVRDPAPPAVHHADWPRTTLDRFILARLEKAGRTPAPAADRRTLLRRAALDLTGLPPSAAEAAAFADDPAPDAWSRAVDRLLASPRYGERWGRHWLDVVRYADTAGETADYPVPVAWRYRNYVIDAFNQDKPYDVFLREQVAGDLLARQGPRERYAERVAATGFLALSRRFGFDSENYHHLTLQDTIDTLGQGVLGLTLGCARCHAHKYDPVPMADYYALYGIFESTRYAFPGSEQKQRIRSLAPLLPPEESRPLWRQYEARVAALARLAGRTGRPVPSAVLRSIDDLDGDFELQAPAAGGSKGVLVPPWIYDGPVAITTDAQSPFKNLHPAGRVGASVPAGPAPYRIRQALHPRRTRAGGGLVHLNLDLRLATNAAPAPGRHRIELGARTGPPAVEVLVSETAVTLRSRGREETVHRPAPGRWFNLHLALDLAAGTVAGRVGTPDASEPIAARPLAPDWDGVLEEVRFHAPGGASDPHPALALDNFGLQPEPPAPVSTEPAALAGDPGTAEAEAVDADLRRWVGIDGGFELQADGTPPATPWGPGPNSVVRVSSGSQSPFRNLLPPGRLGLRLPAGDAYNGFGQTLPQTWKADSTPVLHASLDFRAGPTPAGGGGTWRYYLGHGPGPSAAVELFLDGTRFFRRSGEARDPVGEVTPGEWHQVQLRLDLRRRKYSGLLASARGSQAFEGDFAAGWDGSIDYTFIDSYGHRGGPKPWLDADNFVLGTAPLAAPAGPAVAESDDDRARRARVEALRRRQSELQARAESAARELERLLAEGPVELAYAVSEGTPRAARLQLRGEPDRPGEEVPRGFLAALGGGALPAGVDGSGRLELADWLASPANPLTARVLVNRVWQYHFGQGLVRTPNDFGLRGQPPSHPELLDHLATVFVRGGWSVKALHRLILHSAVYQQQSHGSPGPSATATAAGPADPDCPVQPAPGTADRRPGAPPATEAGLFSPFPRRRLSAEETRDALLQASGSLDLAPGRGHPFPSPTAWGYTQHGPYAAVYEHRKRSVYLMTQRLKRHPFLALFDGADPNASTPERRPTTVPTQALFFLNDPLVHEESATLARRVLAEAGDAGDPVGLAYRRVLGRDPRAAEATEARRFLEAYQAGLAGAGAGGTDPGPGALAALARVLLGSNEFLTVD